MNRKEFIDKVALEAGVTKVVADLVLDAVIDNIVDTVASGDVVRLIGFGNFSSSKVGARKGRNPRTGESVLIEPITRPRFTAGQCFRDAVAKNAK